MLSCIVLSLAIQGSVGIDNTPINENYKIDVCEKGKLELSNFQRKNYSGSLDLIVDSQTYPSGLFHRIDIESSIHRDSKSLVKLSQSMYIDDKRRTGRFSIDSLEYVVTISDKK